MFGKRRFKNTCLFIIMGCLPLIGACPQPMDPVARTAAADGESTLRVEKNAAPIDAAAPDVFATASFGLG